jgi:hypothetical protein
MMSIDVYGWLGYEMQIDTTIRTRVVFAVVDRGRKRMAWFLYSQDLSFPRQQAMFDEAGIGGRKVDRNEAFGETIAYPYLNDYAGTDISQIAPRFMKGPGGRATLFMIDERDSTTTCKIRGLMDTNGTAVSLTFSLDKVADRRTFNLKKPGRVYMLGVERFTAGALKRGITGASKLTGGYDPHNPLN